MTRKKTVYAKPRAAELEDEAMQPQPEERDADVDQEVEDANEVLGQIQGEGIALLIWRQNPRTMQWEYCEQVQGQGYTLEQLRASWGAGRFRMRFRDATTQVWRGSKTFVVAAGAPSPSAVPGLAHTPTYTTMPDRGAGADRMEKLLDAMVARALQPSDTFDKVISAAAALSPVLIALVQRRGSDPVEVATQMATLLQNAGGKANPTEMATEMLKTFREGMTLGAKLDGGGVQTEQSWVDLARDYLPPILGVIQRGQQAPGSVTTPPVVVQQLPQSAAAASGGPVAPLSPSGGTPVPPAARSGFYAAFRPFVPRLVEAAREQEDPDELAYNIVGFVTGWQRSMLADAAARPDWLTEPFAQYPELEGHRLWVTGFLSAVRKQFTPDAEGGDG